MSLLLPSIIPQRCRPAAPGSRTSPPLTLRKPHRARSDSREPSRRRVPRTAAEERAHQGNLGNAGVLEAGATVAGDPVRTEMPRAGRDLVGGTTTMADPGQ